MSGRTYRDAGVLPQDDALSAVARHLGPTLRRGAATILAGFGHYAAVLQVSGDLAVAISTDGVGSKTLIASMLDRYDTIGFDCVAMNVNDLICVGARPLALVDYLAVHALDDRRTEEILRGLGDAASACGIAVPGGEIAQLPDVIASDAGGGAFDLVGTSLGTLAPSEVILGRAVRPGDALVGLASSGIHSNGLTLARRALLERGAHRLEDDVPELGRTLGEELLEPTSIYVAPVLELWGAGIATHGLAHITGDGLLNLRRISPRVGYAIEDLFEAPPIFELIQRAGDVSAEDMFAVFNMGIGFVVVVPAAQSADAVAIVAASGHRAARIGTVTDEAGAVRIEPAGLTWTTH